MVCHLVHCQTSSIPSASKSVLGFMESIRAFFGGLLHSCYRVRCYRSHLVLSWCPTWNFCHWLSVSLLLGLIVGKGRPISSQLLFRPNHSVVILWIKNLHSICSVFITIIQQVPFSQNSVLPVLVENVRIEESTPQVAAVFFKRQKDTFFGHFAFFPHPTTVCFVAIEQTHHTNR